MGGKYLPLGGRPGSSGWRGMPVIGLEVVELIKLEADVLDGELQHVPKTSQVLGRGPRVGIHILRTKEEDGMKTRGAAGV